MNSNSLYIISQEISQPTVKDIEKEIIYQLNLNQVNKVIKKGDRVAITAGSRGISNIVDILKILVEQLKLMGTNPFIVAAMGSHGGATAQGQLDILSDLGINEDSVKAPIISSMEVVELGFTQEGARVFIDKTAYESDAIIVVNRIKSHTKFRGENESGLIKMISIGLGKEKGCTEMHAFGLYPVIVNSARIALKKAPIKFGLGIIENANKDIAKIMIVDNENMEKEDAKMLKMAKKLMPSLPADEIDLMIVEEMGKNISGPGMDVNIIGRMNSIFMSDEKPRIKRIVALDLHPLSHGNAIGMALADIITRRFRDKIDFKATYANALAAGAFDKVKMPIVLESDRDAINAAYKSISGNALKEPKVLLIKNTIELNKMLVTQSLLNSIEADKRCTIIGKTSIEFDDGGYLIKKGWW